MRPDAIFKRLARKGQGLQGCSTQKGRLLTSAEHFQRKAGQGSTHPPFHAHTADQGKRAAKRIDARLAEG